MFNWLSVPTFGTMLLAWLLAAYVLTRNPGSRVPQVAAGALASVALYMFGQGMVENASTVEEWLPWSKSLVGGAIVAAALWYWTTALLLHEQDAALLRAYVRVALLLGMAISVIALIVLGILYSGDGLWIYSAVTVRQAPYSGLIDFFVPTGSLYPLFAVLLLITTIGALLNLEVGRRRGARRGVRGPFMSLLISGLLYAAAALGLGIVNWLAPDSIPIWVGHAALGLATTIFAWTVAAHSLLVQEASIGGDFVYFLSAVGLVCGIYGLVFWVARPVFSMTQLAMVAMILSAAILTHALVDVGRRALDRLFFDPDTRRLRASLSGVVQAAGVAPSVDSLIAEASSEVVRVQADRLVGLTVWATNLPLSQAEPGRSQRAPAAGRDARVTKPFGPSNCSGDGKPRASAD